MKTVIRSDELYPFYDHVSKIADVPSYQPWAREVPDEVIEKWDRVMGEFWKVQDEMESYYAKSK